MRIILLATTILALGGSAAMAQVTTGTAAAITPGSGALTDAAGNKWDITASGSVQENGQWTPGGGGTAELTIENGVVYGKDDGHGSVDPGGWFALSGQSWSPSAAPSDALTAGPASSTPATGTASQITPTTTCAATPGGAATGTFTTANGQIIGPTGAPFIAKGINLYDANMGNAAQVLADFPGINFIRLAVYSYLAPSAFTAFVQQMAAKGVVVEIEHHVGAGGGVPALTGGDLTAENQWFASLATAFKGSPNVWFGTLNEPASGGGLAAEQTSNYQAIRGTGNNNIIMLSEPIDASTAGMTNVVIDQHFYGWTSGYSTNQATVTANLMQTIQQDQQATGGLPVIIGETGPATDGANVDANAAQVLSADMGSGYGAAFWNWDSGAPQDNLTQGGQMTSYGQTVAGWIALVGNAPASIWAVGCSGAPTTTATQQAATQ